MFDKRLDSLETRLQERDALTDSRFKALESGVQTAISRADATRGSKERNYRHGRRHCHIGQGSVY